MPADNDRILEIARTAPIRAYRWKNRGRAPTGYIDGMAIAFAEACRDLRAGGAVSALIAADRAGDANHDVLDWYADILRQAGLPSNDPAERLVCIFAVMLGLGMRESSGKHCEGRDMSADNVSAETAEAGLFQVSHDSIGSHPELQPLFDRFRGHDDLLTVFDDGVHCQASSWTDWGDGPGKEFQALMKQCPKFAVLYTGILLRHARRHWGPINRKEAEVTADSAALFRDLRGAVDQEEDRHSLSEGRPMDALADYPDLQPFLDPTAEGAAIERTGDDNYLVTLRGEEGGQFLLRRTGGEVELLAADNVVQFSREPTRERAACAGECTADQYTIVAQAIIDAVDHFSSAAGPDHGNLACLWSVRHIVYNALGFWITHSDGTADFYPDLVACFGHDRPPDQVPAGGIIISPTTGSNIGHIGLLGTGQGDARLIYSNSSAAAMWKQNHTVGSWRARYHDLKHLQVYFFPLPRF